jgi:hypothetical protein
MKKKKKKKKKIIKKKTYDNGIAALAKECLTENSYYPITNAL